MSNIPFTTISRNRISRHLFTLAGMIVLIMLILAGPTIIYAIPPSPTTTFTLDADFDRGVLLNVNHDAPHTDQLQLNATGRAFNYIWVAASNRGTIVKIDTLTGTILGEYHSAPQGRGLSPSRTTVDANGNVWAGNRAEEGEIGGVPHGSVVKIGLEENGQCIDSNGNGIIDTSTGLGDIRPWPDITDGVGSTDGAAHVAQVQDAQDECILIYQRTPDADAVRHVSVDVNNDVWIGGYNSPYPRSFNQLEEHTGAILATFDARTFTEYGCGGYGGLIDKNNILWSASISQFKVLRYDLGAETWTCIDVTEPYGLGIDSHGFIWNSMWTEDTIVKISPAGDIQAGFPKPTGGGSFDRGVAVTADDHVWVANSGGQSVSRLDNDGNLLAVISVENVPTGVAVDAAGKVWATNLGSDTVSRIDPSTNTVDLTVFLGAGAGPYNYSDMTGSIVPALPNHGAWSIIQDSGATGTAWGTITWNDEPEGATPGNSSLTVQARSSEDMTTWSSWESVTYGTDLTVPDGRYLEVRVLFTRSSTDGDGDGLNDSPILSDLSISVEHQIDLSAFVLFATEGVALKKDVSVVSGGIGANSASAGPYLANGVEVSLDKGVAFLDPAAPLVGDSIFIGRGAQVFDVFYNELTNRGVILGTETTPLELPIVPAFPEIPVFTAGAEDIRVQKGETATLAAGSYRNLEVDKGATVIFSGGVYDFENWNVAKDVDLYFDTPTEIRIADKLSVNQNSYLGPGPSATNLDASDIFLYVLGENGTNGDINSNPEAAKFGKNLSIQANVYVPNGTLIFGQETEATGGFLARWIHVLRKTTLILDSGW